MCSFQCGISHVFRYQNISDFSPKSQGNAWRSAKKHLSSARDLFWGPANLFSLLYERKISKFPLGRHFCMSQFNCQRFFSLEYPVLIISLATLLWYLMHDCWARFNFVVFCSISVGAQYLAHFKNLKVLI